MAQEAKGTFGDPIRNGYDPHNLPPLEPDEVDVVPDAAAKQYVLKLSADIAKEWDESISFNSLVCAV
jgi:hypothetical protein